MTWFIQNEGKIFNPGHPTTTAVPAGFYKPVETMDDWALMTHKVITDTLIDVPGTPVDEVATDVATFLASREKYEALDLTHKRGYLLYGPPGTGKTSLGILLARRFVEEHNGVCIIVSDLRSFIGGFELLQKQEPGRPSMYLLEEGDSYLNHPRALAILDGELSAAGTVFVAMTNHVGEMPPRLANRPGRFDRVVHIPVTPRPVQLAYLERLQARSPGLAVADDIVNALAGLAVTMAHLREAFIAHVILGQPIADVATRFRAMFAQEG